MDFQEKLVAVLTILTITTLASFALGKILSRISTLATLPNWAKNLAKAFYTPSFWLIAGTGILLCLNVLFEGDHLVKIQKVFIIIALAWTLNIWKNGTIAYLKQKGAHLPNRLADEALLLALGKMAAVAIFSIAFLFILDVFNIQLTAIIAFGGIGGLALGWAGKDVVVNFFGGLMVHITRPFTIGETIRSPNKNFEGVVEHIGWYLTKIRTFARQPTYIPNALFLDAIIENSGRMYNRRILQRIGLRYEDMKKVDSVCKAITQMLAESKEIDQQQKIIVQMAGFGPSSLDIDIICFTKTIDRFQWLAIQHEVLLKIGAIVEEMGAEFAYPTNTIHINNADAMRQFPQAFACSESTN